MSADTLETWRQIELLRGAYAEGGYPDVPVYYGRCTCSRPTTDCERPAIRLGAAVAVVPPEVRWRAMVATAPASGGAWRAVCWPCYSTGAGMTCEHDWREHDHPPL